MQGSTSSSLWQFSGPWKLFWLLGLHEAKKVKNHWNRITIFFVQIQFQFLFKEICSKFISHSERSFKSNFHSGFFNRLILFCLGDVHIWRHGLRVKDFLKTVQKVEYQKSVTMEKGCQKLSRIAWRYLWTPLIIQTSRMSWQILDLWIFWVFAFSNHFEQIDDFKYELVCEPILLQLNVIMVDVNSRLLWSNFFKSPLSGLLNKCDR